MENNVTSIFVYGTLRRSFYGEAYKYLSDYFSFIGNAKVKGILYLGRYPAAIASSTNTFIAGELYELKHGKEFSKAIKQLDKYEGVNEQKGEMSLYCRKLTEVIFKNTKVTAWIYWYNKPIHSEALIATGDIMDFIEINNKP